MKSTIARQTALTCNSASVRVEWPIVKDRAGIFGRAAGDVVASGGLLTPSGSELSRLAFDRCSPLRLPAYFCCSPCFRRAL